MLFQIESGTLVAKHCGETLRIEAWGTDSLRVRATMFSAFTDRAWALTENICKGTAEVTIYPPEEWSGDPDIPCGKPVAVVRNGRASAVVNDSGVLSFYRDETLVLREYFRAYGGTISKGSRCLKIVSREWKGVIGGSDYQLTVRFDARDGEKLYGMGQYQQPYLDLKGTTLELAQRNSQIIVPFLVSSIGYGFLWNNPAVGSVTFAKNRTEWVARSAKDMDYWFTVADTPKEILKTYTAVSGRAPAFPSDRLGLWQCKLRYRTQDEVLRVARAYANEGIQIDQIIIDFFHWPYQGEWRFDTRYWPDVRTMCEELHRMGIKVMVSVWPTVDRRSGNFYPMRELGLLIRTERGAEQTYDFQGDCVGIDAFNPETRDYIWQRCKQNYYDLGIDGFWLDNAEPDFGVYDFEQYRYRDMPALSCSNMYPQMYSRAFFEPMTKLGNGSVVNLIRSCWAGSQKHGNVVWSGDVPSTFQAFREQLQAGLNIGLAGIPWWTTDIGGFMTDDVRDPDFQELLIRWYQFAVYSAVFRMHGDRGPYTAQPLDERDFGGGYMPTGQSNELWSYGEDCYHIMKKYYDIRIGMRDYIQKLFDEASENGSPLIRTMFYEFPNDAQCWRTEDQYMFGERYLCAPVFALHAASREVYLPAGQWKLTSTGEIMDGGKTVTVDAPIDYMPVFERVR